MASLVDIATALTSSDTDHASAVIDSI